MAWLTRQQAAALSEDQRMEYLAYTLLGEAVGEGEVGMLVVGQHIANRAADARFPTDPVAVAGQAYQFTANAPGAGGNIDTMKRLYPKTSPEYQQAVAAARASIIDKTIPDITGGSIQYHTIAMGFPESWPQSVKQHGFVDIGRHRIYPSRQIEPGVIPANLAKVREFGVDAAVDVVRRDVAPIRPAKLSANLKLQREVNRVAQQRADAPATIRAARALAFTATNDPFEIGRPSNSNLIINRPEPAMRQAMQNELRATGTLQSTARTFAIDSAAAQGQDAGLTLRLNQAMGAKPPAVSEAPWGVRESVAAAVAATDVAAGRNQLVMTGNPNIAGSVVDWLYPRVEEGQGEANQVGKGPRAVAQAAQPSASDMARAAKTPPRVVVDNGRVRITTEPNTDDTIRTSIDRTRDATDSTVAVSLAANIAAKQVRDRKQEEAVTPSAASNIRTQATEQAVQRATANVSTASSSQNIKSQAAEQQAQRAATTTKPRAVVSTVPGPNAVPKITDRLAASSANVALEFKPTTTPAPRANAIGSMPSFKDLATIGGASSALSLQTGKQPVSVSASDLARGKSQPVKLPAVATPKTPTTTPPKAAPTPAQRPTTVAPQPTQATVKPTVKQPVAATVKPVAPVRSVAPAKAPAPPAERTAAPIGNNQAPTVRQIQERARDATSQSGDNSTGNQRDAADARSSGEGGRTRRY